MKQTELACFQVKSAPLKDGRFRHGPQNIEPHQSRALKFPKSALNTVIVGP